ncbi:MAG TPA: riboflavin synthase [Spirochaetota bacterium]|mgnify:CR=1 FL=1|nr:riboflavin synthase [Spirochaetota bacterium]HPC41651.1 riboflavin synthase [Spirochaetota bacterium]HPL16344.1 riboflavin synthase [Spirochaetota bacterium]HQF09324.1 riboflavin synthase [Spirochaetota bacterium]HQH98272.1 riboflavin synthase [Spirochaetota bacterium]
MFTGLIEEIGKVAAVSRAGDGLHLTINAERVLDGTRVGDSICINGACQTVTALDRRSFTVFVSAVTASVTTLGSFAAGRKVNLERAMTPSSRFGGHFVQGHVDGRGAVDAIEKDSMGMRVRIAAGPDLARYIVGKGSIAVDGVSLTVVSVDEKGFTLYFIPETLGNTVVSEWKTGVEVNIEVDILAKYVERMLRPGSADDRSGDRTLMKKLAEGGFV